MSPIQRHQHPRARRPKADRWRTTRIGRQRGRRWALRLGLLVAAILAGSCGATDRPLLEQFFYASRLRDLTALRSIATTVFDPARDGIVRSFRVVRADAAQQAAGAYERHVTVDADVILPDGTETQKTLVVTVRSGGPAAAAGSTEWRVTAVQ